MEIDLNLPDQQQEDNPKEVILNPVQPPQGDFLELNDLMEGNNMVEEIILAQNIPELAPDEQNLMNLADEMQM